MKQMVYIFSRLSLPACKTEELVKMNAIEGPKFDHDRFGTDLFEDLVPTAIRTTLKGGEVITVSKVKPGKLENAMKAMNSWYAVFTKIEGAEISIDVYYSAEEVAEMLAPSSAKPAPSAKPAKAAK
jgi:hypothetical protein